MKFQKGNLEKQVLKLPENVEWCKNCVISNQRPRIVFDDNGICSACNNLFYKKHIDWEVREKELSNARDIRPSNR